tara:strand:+ start:48 stop:557 length:510 start_codon:yes stop_codon:yes gene_type:complete
MILDLSTFLNILNTVAIIAAGIFAAVQLLQLKKQRSRESALQMLNSVQTPEFIDALNIIYNLSGDLTKKEIEDELGDKLSNVMVMFVKLESLGLLVFKREIKLDLVADFMRGPIILFWNKMKNYFIETRELNNDENFGEWVQWLAEQIENELATKNKKPAHLIYKTWKK